MMQVQRSAASVMHCLLPCMQRMQQQFSHACLVAHQQHAVARLAVTASTVIESCGGVVLQQNQRQQSAPAAATLLEGMSYLHLAVQRALLRHSRTTCQQHSSQVSRCYHSSSSSSRCILNHSLNHTSNNSLQVCCSFAAVAAAAASGHFTRCPPDVPAHYSWHLSACRTLSSSGTDAGPRRSFSSRSSSSSDDGGSSGSNEYVFDDIHSITADTINSGKLPEWSSRSSGSSSSNNRGKVVAVAVSGGVDSAVSAMLLKRLGYKVFGVYMHNWDASDEAGSCAPACTSTADLADAKQVCAALGMPLYEADFVSQYWTSVFAAFLEGLEQGLTPNPDLACNSHIKFGALLQFAKQKGADVLATGHYARMAWRCSEATEDAAADAANGPTHVQQQQQQRKLQQPVLLAGADPLKDQTYFLAGLNQQQLASAMFPVGHLSKGDVRRMAAAAQLPMADKRSSAGICFIGRRSFGRFLQDYLTPKPGVYVDIDNGQQLGSCSNMLAVTVGQKAVGLGGQQERVYVAGKDMTAGVVHVARGREHPALYSSRVVLLPPNWIGNAPPTGAAASGVAGASSCSGSSGSGVIRCSYRARYRQPPASCCIRPMLPGEQFAVSRYCGSWQHSTAAASVKALQQETQAPQAAAAAAGIGSTRLAATVAAAAVQEQQRQGSQQQGMWVAELEEPLRGITPGQMFVLYDGQVCLGSAMIAAHGLTMAEEQ